MSDSERRGYCPSIDGLRGIAILLVLGFHFGVPGFERGFLGVDVFFVISGFLITSLIAQEHRRTHAFRFPRFWMRRVLRLLPLYYLYVGLCVGGLALGLLAYRGATWNATLYVASLAFYFSNFGISNGIHAGRTQLTSHLWSLAIEEQFYLVWPFVCAFVLRRRAFWVPWLLGLGSLVALQRTTTWDSAAFLLHTRGFSLCAGCIAALHVARDERASWLGRTWIQVAAVGTAVLIYAAVTARPTLSNLTVYRAIVPPVAIMVAVCCATLWTRRDGALSRVLSLPALVYIGKISYGLYVWHMLCRVAILPMNLGRLGTATASIALSIVVASASYYLYELPFLRLKDRFRS